MTEQTENGRAPKPSEESEQPYAEAESAEREESASTNNSISTPLSESVADLEEAWNQVDEVSESYAETIDELIAKRQALLGVVTDVAENLSEPLGAKMARIDKIFTDEYKKTRDSERAWTDAAATAERAAAKHSQAQEKAAKLAASYAELQAYPSASRLALEEIEELQRDVQAETDPAQKYAKLNNMKLALRALELTSADSHLAALRNARDKLKEASENADVAAGSLARLEAAANSAAEEHEHLVATRPDRIAAKIEELSESATPAAA